MWGHAKRIGANLEHVGKRGEKEMGKAVEKEMGRRVEKEMGRRVEKEMGRRVEKEMGRRAEKEVVLGGGLGVGMVPGSMWGRRKR
jgi:hypothetical protein